MSLQRQRGHVRREGRTWRLQLREASTPGERRRRVSVRLGTVAELPTKAAARRAADRWIEQRHPRPLHAGSVVSWGAWCDTYADRHLAMLSSGTRRTQTSILECHLRGAFDGPVHGITPEAVQAFLVEQHRAGVSAATIAARFAVLRRVLRQAAAEGLAVTPPRGGEIVLPKDEAVHATIRTKAFTPAEARAILDAAADPWGTAYALALYAGLRAGEVLGLTWEAIDLASGRLEVRQQAIDGAVRPLKTRGSLATLQAPAPLLARLRAYRETWTPNAGGFLFADDSGRPLRRSELRQALHALLEQLGLRRRGMHAFRHSCALAMAAAGCNPEVIRRALRHSSLRVTAVYLSAAPEDIAAALERAADACRCAT